MTIVKHLGSTLQIRETQPNTQSASWGIYMSSNLICQQMYRWGDDHKDKDHYETNRPRLIGFRNKKAAFRSYDKEAYNTARARLKAGIKDAESQEETLAESGEGPQHQLH